LAILLGAALCGAPALARTGQAQGAPAQGPQGQGTADAAASGAPAKPITALRICGDPGNMPLSDQKGEGYENKIADVLAAALDTGVVYFWRPYIERGLTRQTFDSNDCDVLMDMPADYESMATTFPIYRSTYVFAYRADRGIKIKNLDDPVLKKLKVGVYEASALREALANHGVKRNVSVHVLSHDADLVPEHQPWVQVQQVVDGKLDVAAVWGPFAGWLKTMKGAPLVIEPTNLMDDDVPMEFDMAIGTRRTDAALKSALERALRAHKDDIRAILERYGVPLVACNECLVSGPIPSHGPYGAKALGEEQRASPPGAPVVSQAELSRWLAQGADVNQELANAVLASDARRVTFLLGKGAQVGWRDPEGYAPLHIAARAGDAGMLKLLLEHHADPDEKDTDGWTALLYAVLENRAPALEALIAHHANVEATAPGGYSALQLAVEEQKYGMANLLIDAGAAVNVQGGPERVTPLMIAASVSLRGPAGPETGSNSTALAVAKHLIAKGANLNATTQREVTAAMIAAARNNGAMISVLIEAGADLGRKSEEGRTALDIARENGADDAAKRLEAAGAKAGAAAH
jgi:quinoprotein dehydrogenase-associated probable ABC transporter substrate-binding protein